ncbi:hypothetical protein HZS_3174 [Henneguya salminicola]|nr:hypothetical protein HZS_3174 [Henneguya salminicola]
MAELICYNGLTNHKNFEVKKYLTNVENIMLIISAENVQVKGKHICDPNESTLTRITYDNISQKFLLRITPRKI